MNPFEFSGDINGKLDDLWILRTEEWLKDAIVNYWIINRKGRFWVNITYRHPKQAFHFIVKEIDHYPDHATAERFAQIFVRGIGGNKKNQDHAFHICTN